MAILPNCIGVEVFLPRVVPDNMNTSTIEQAAAAHLHGMIDSKKQALKPADCSQFKILNLKF
jgi:hypothetical protein